MLLVFNVLLGVVSMAKQGRGEVGIPLRAGLMNQPWAINGLDHY